MSIFAPHSILSSLEQRYKKMDEEMMYSVTQETLVMGFKNWDWLFPYVSSFFSYLLLLFINHSLTP